MKTSFVFVLALSAGLASSAMAGTIRLDTTAYSAGVGGEFQATVLSGYVGEVGGAASLSASTFETFCLEHQEEFRPGDTYNVTLNTAAVFGGTDGGEDPIDDRTAFLYTRFREGTLPGFDYSAAGRQASSGQLQNAIWFLEDEQGGVNNAFVALANAAVAVGGEWYGQGIGNVRVMNMSNAEFPHAQDQLTLISIPLPSAAGLAGLGLGAGLIRRRRA
jgi:hypothetical protein